MQQQDVIVYLDYNSNGGVHLEIHLNEIMEQRGLSVNQLHKMTGISRTTLDPLAKSKQLPSKTRIETLERICKELEISMNDLITENTLYKVVDYLPYNFFQDFRHFNKKGMYTYFRKELAVEVSIVFEYYFLIEVSNDYSKHYFVVNVNWIVPTKNFEVTLDVDKSILEYKENLKIYDRFDEFTENLSSFKVIKAICDYIGDFYNNIVNVSNTAFETLESENKLFIKNEQIKNNKYSYYNERIQNEVCIFYSFKGFNNWDNDTDHIYDFKYIYDFENKNLKYYTIPKISFDY